MIGGLKTVSRVAIVAAAGIMAGGVAAQAADLGGNCCADLEERVAELEATTARKGNRRVSLEVSGHVNEMMVFWSGDQALQGRNTVASPGVPGFTPPGLQDDDSGFAVLTNNNSRSRFRFRGSAKINADWSAGFLIEVGVRGTNNSQGVTADDLNNKSGLDVRHEALYLQSKSFGTVWLGHTGSASEGITEICLGCASGQGMDSGPYLGAYRPFGSGFANNAVALNLNANTGALRNRRTLDGFSWMQLASSTGGQFSSGEGDRRDIVMYQTPSIAGFILSAAAGSDEFYDVALRYAGEFSGFRIAAGVGYQKSREQGLQNAVDAGNPAAAGSTAAKGFASGCIQDGDGRVDCEAIGASASIMHTPTGLYIAGAYGETRDNNAIAANDTDQAWYVTGGINKKFFALGATNIYGEYGEARRQIGLDTDNVWTAANGLGGNVGAETGVRWYGAGISQTIDAAAMDIYLNYKHYEGIEDARGAADLDIVALGAIIRF